VNESRNYQKADITLIFRLNASASLFNTNPHPFQ